MSKKLLSTILFYLLLFGLLNVEIVYASPTYEDFTTYTEVEPDNRIQKTAYHADFNAYRNEDSHLYKDYGDNYFGDFEHFLDVNHVSDVGTWDNGFVWFLSEDTVDDFYGLNTASKTGFGVNFQGKNTAGQFRFRLRETYGGNIYASATYPDGVSGIMYYLRIKKVGTMFTCRIWSDSTDRDNNDIGAGSYLAEVSLTLQADHSCKYLFVCNTYNDAQPYNAEYDIENLDLQEVEIWTVTFHNNTGGILMVDNVTVVNGTETSYDNNTEIKLVAVVEGNLTYGFNNFTYDTNYNISNPYNWTIVFGEDNITLWCYFEPFKISENEITYPSSVSIGVVTAIIVCVVIFAFLYGKKTFKF